MLNKIKDLQKACQIKCALLIAFGLYFVVFIMNEIYCKIEILFRKPNAYPNFFANLENNSNENKTIPSERA